MTILDDELRCADVRQQRGRIPFSLSKIFGGVSEWSSSNWAP
jgi:hypothetical protein